MKSFEKLGGIASLSHAGALVASIVMAVTLIFPILNADAGEYLTFVANNQSIMRVWILMGYWVTAASLVVMALALYDRMKTGSPALMQVATVFGIIWAALIIGSGNLMLHDFGVIADLYGKDPAQALTVWTALEAVENGIVSGNELVGGLWVLLLSVAGLRSGALPKALTFAGLALGAAGILTLIPTFVENTGPMVFGLGLIVWSIWVGLALLRSSARPAEQKSAAIVGRKRAANI